MVVIKEFQIVWRVDRKEVQKVAMKEFEKITLKEEEALKEKMRSSEDFVKRDTIV